MALTDIPQDIRDNYEVHEWRHAVAVLIHDFPDEYKEMLDCLNSIVLTKADILTDGGGKSPIANAIDSVLIRRGWKEVKFDTSFLINGEEKKTPTHKIDCYKNKIAIEIEWNNKTEFYDRDLNNFRLLHDRGVVSVGVIITRASELQLLFNKLGKGTSYGATSTHMDKLVPRIDGGSGGGCPILIFGIRNALFEDPALVSEISKDIADKKGADAEKKRIKEEKAFASIERKAAAAAKRLATEQAKEDNALKRIEAAALKLKIKEGVELEMAKLRKRKIVAGKAPKLKPGGGELFAGDDQ